MTNETCSSPWVSKGDLNYGIYRLDSPCLQSHLYPDDLPGDWRLEYYNNEFSVILTTLEELAVEMGLNRNSVIAMCANITHIVDELHEYFMLLIELTPDELDSFSNDELEQLQNFSSTRANFYFIRSTESASQINIDVTDFALFQLVILFTKEAPTRESIDRDSLVEERTHCLLIKEKCLLKPPVLRQLLECCLQLADKQDECWVLFSSEQHALENCRNAILMDSLM